MDNSTTLHAARLSEAPAHRANRARAARFAQVLLLLLMLAALVPAAAGAAPGGPAAAGAAAGSVAFVAVADHDYVAVVDPALATVSITIEFRPGACDFPWRLAIPPDGQTLWVSCRQSSSVLVLDAATLGVLEAIALDWYPGDIAFTQDGSHAVIGSFSYGDVVAVDTTTFAVVATVPTGERPMAVVMHPYLPVAYVVHRQRDGLVTAIDTTTWTIAAQNKTGGEAQYAAISPDGRALYLANQQGQSISVIDTRTLEETAEIPLGVRPRDLAVSPDGSTLYVTRAYDEQIAIVDTQSNQVQQTLALSTADDFERPWGTALSCDGSTLVTTSSVISSEENREVAITATGSLETVLVALPDLNNDGYPEGGARGVVICPQHVADGIFLVPEAQTQQAGRGEEAVYTFELYNFSGTPDSYDLSLGPQQWNGVLSTASLGPLPHGGSATFTVTVTVPADAPWYATDAVDVTAASTAAPGVYTAAAAVTTEAYAPPAMTLSPPAFSSVQEAGETVTQTLQIANGSGVPLTFELGTSFGPGTAFAAASTELYGYTPSYSVVRVVGLVDDTEVQIVNLADGSVLAETGALARYETWQPNVSAGTFFKVAATEPVVALVSDGSHWGYTSFIPSVDQGLLGQAFIFHHSQGDAFLYVFAVDDAEVVFHDDSGAVRERKSLAAGEYLKLNPDTGVYRVTATGRVALELVAENSYTTVPAVAPGPGGQAVGRRFFFATDGWQSGAVAAFAYEDADLALYDLNDDTLVAGASVKAGAYWWYTGLQDRQLRLESSGDVEVWAGNTEGGEAIEDLGDDISFAGGRLGREYYLHALREGFVIFAPFAQTSLMVDDVPYTLDKDDYLHFPTCCGTHHISASRPILVQTLGADSGWNDMGTYLGGVVAHSGEPVPWLSIDPATGTVGTEASSDVTLAFDAAGVQPGRHAADLIVATNDPARLFVEVPVEMGVTPAPDMGSVAGAVTDAWTGEPLPAGVTLEGVHTVEHSSGFEIWALAGTYRLSAAAGGYAGQTVDVTIKAGSQTEQNIALEPDRPRVDVSPQRVDLAAVAGSTTLALVTVENSGPAPLQVSFHEMEAADEPRAATLAGRKILYDRGHGQPPLSEFETVTRDLTAAGATVDPNFVVPITAATLEGYDVLWVSCCGYGDWGTGELAALTAWLEAGGAVFVYGEESPTNRQLARLYGIDYRSGCSDGITTAIATHPITTDVAEVRVQTCAFLTHGNASTVVVKDRVGQPHVVAHEAGGGKMVVLAGADLNNWLVDQGDNRQLATNIFTWLGDPGYVDVAWLAVDPAQATFPGHTSQQVTVHGDAGALAGGEYHAVLAIEHDDPDRRTPLQIPVTLVVGSAAPKAAFSAAPTGGAPPMVVSFTNLSTGDIDTCLWNFGDGSTEATCGNPVHLYKREGRYTVSLTVTGPGGEDTLTAPRYIDVAYFRSFLPGLLAGAPGG